MRLAKDDVSFPETRWTLIEAARRGDETAVSTFTERYRPAVVRYLTGRGLAQDAEDLAQEVFLRLFRGGGLEGVDPGKGRFRALVRAISGHVLGDHVRRRQAQKRGGDAPRVPLEGDLAAPADDADRFDRAWIKSLLEAAFARLAHEHPAYHEVLQAHLVEGHTQAEVAARSGRTLKAVKHATARGKGKLIELLRQLVIDYTRSAEEFEEEWRALSGHFPGS